MAENKYNLYELQKKIHYKTVSPILTAWDEQSDNDVTDLARMAYEAGRNSISKEKNKMAEVAKLFGVELDEEFDVAIQGTICTVSFTERGLIGHPVYYPNDFLLRALLTGKAVVIDG